MMKYFWLACAACAAFIFVSCLGENVDEKARSYAVELIEADRNGDEQKMLQLRQDAESWASGLSDEDRERVQQVVMETVKQQW